MGFEAGRRFLLLSPMLVFGQDSGDAIWRKVLAWLEGVPASQNPANLIAEFQAALRRDGASAADLNNARGAILRGMKSQVDGWQKIFNKIYASKTPGFSTKPNALLVSAVEDTKPGRALDVGMGQGRNSVFLAIRGWDVSGFDVSDEGLAVARRNAEAAGVKLQAVMTSNEAFDFGEGRWDLIVITYEPFPLTDKGYVARLARALRPGGRVVIESFASNADAPGRKPVDIDPRGLLQAFQQGFQIRRFEDVMAVPDWDPARTRVVRMVAEKDSPR